MEIGDDELRVPRTQLAALDPATGAIDPDFRPRFVDSYPGIWALAATSTRLYAGGYFSAAGASPPRQHPYFAMFGGVAANAAPTAQATASPSPALVDQDITLSASGSDDVETPDALTFAWDLGNGGTTNDATGEVVHHTYPQAGRYTATVTVTDAGGARDTASVVVVVNDRPNTPPTARATTHPAETLPGEEVTLSASGSGDAEDPDNLDFEWDLGDGETAAGEVVRHAYQQAGHYTVTVAVPTPTATATRRRASSGSTRSFPARPRRSISAAGGGRSRATARGTGTTAPATARKAAGTSCPSASGVLGSPSCTATPSAAVRRGCSSTATGRRTSPSAATRVGSSSGSRGSTPGSAPAGTPSASRWCARPGSSKASCSPDPRGASEIQEVV